jgi:molybdopterin-containing oxidoreductase family membrane subunit
MIFNFISLLLKKEKRAKIFAIIAFIMVTMGNLNMNSDMALLGTRGFWSENYMPLYFLSLSTLTGCAAILLFGWIVRKAGWQVKNIETEKATYAVGRLFLFILLGVLYFTGVKIMGGFFPQFTKNPEAMFLLVQGGFSLNFWLGEVALAVVIPLLIVLLTRGKNETYLALAGLSCLIGAFVLFYDLVIVGQLIPHYFQYNVVGLPEYYSYSPGLHEIMVTAGSVFFFLAAFIAGEMIIRKFSMD